VVSGRAWKNTRQDCIHFERIAASARAVSHQTRAGCGASGRGEASARRLNRRRHVTISGFNSLLVMRSFAEKRSEFAPRSTELMCSYDLRGNIIEINEALERAIGYSRQEVRGMNVSELLDAASVEAARMDILKHVGGANPGPRQVIARAKNGRRITLELTTRLVFEKGTPVA